MIGDEKAKRGTFTLNAEKTHVQLKLDGEEVEISTGWLSAASHIGYMIKTEPALLSQASHGSGRSHLELFLENLSGITRAKFATSLPRCRWL